MKDANVPLDPTFRLVAKDDGYSCGMAMVIGLVAGTGFLGYVFWGKLTWAGFGIIAAIIGIVAFLTFEEMIYLVKKRKTLGAFRHRLGFYMNDKYVVANFETTFFVIEANRLEGYERFYTTSRNSEGNTMTEYTKLLVMSGNERILCNLYGYNWLSVLEQYDLEELTEPVHKDKYNKDYIHIHEY